MSLQEQVDALLAVQGGSTVEDDLLHGRVVAYGGSATSPGVNDTRIVLLESGTQAFHKPFAGIDVQVALAFGHHPDQVPINECAAWRLAVALGEPLAGLVAPCVMWSHSGEAGSLTRRLGGVSRTPAPLTEAVEQCRAAAFFDALISQQDRHFGNVRWDAAGCRVGLFDHGYSFGLPGQRSNAAVFVDWRWRSGGQALDGWERDALERVVADDALLGLDSVLSADRGAALRARADRMLAAGTVLRPGEH